MGVDDLQWDDRMIFDWIALHCIALHCNQTRRCGVGWGVTGTWLVAYLVVEDYAECHQRAFCALAGLGEEAYTLERCDDCFCNRSSVATANAKHHRLGGGAVHQRLHHLGPTRRGG